jgi:hypothetical protein
VNSLGYADIVKAVGDDTKVSLIPTTEELEACYSAGKERGGATRLVRGVIEDLDLDTSFAIYVSNNESHPNSELVREMFADLNHESRIFRPTADGYWYHADPYYENWRMTDLIVSGGGFDDRGLCVELATICELFWSTGRCPALGLENLKRPTSEASPLLVFFESIAQYREEGEGRGVMILKPSAKALLAGADWIRLNDWFFVGDFVDGFASHKPHKISGPPDAENFTAAAKARKRQRANPGWVAQRYYVAIFAPDEEIGA